MTVSLQYIPVGRNPKMRYSKTYLNKDKLEMY